MTENEARLILDVRISRFDHAGDVNEALEIAKQALQEIQQYREIGTVKECREAVEKQKAKKPKEILRHRGGFELRHCPNCNTDYEVDGRYTITDGYREINRMTDKT